MRDEQTASPLERFEDLLASEDVGEEPAPHNADGHAGDISGYADDTTEADLNIEDAAALQEDQEQPENDSVIEEVEPADTIAIDIDGQTRRLTAAEVRDGILMRSDYTRKTQELAEQRKAFDAERQQADTYLRQQMEMVRQLEDPEPDWDTLYDEDPLGAPKIERDWRARQSQRHQALQQRAVHQEQARQQHLVQQAALLPELIPEWSDPGVAKTEQADLRQALIDDGFSPDDVALVADARLVKWLRAAHRQFKAERAAAGVVRKKVAGKPRVQRPGSATGRPGSRSVTAAKRDAARKSQSKDAWTRVFEDFI